MPKPNHYDTVAFDVRDNTTMLFFAKTQEEGDIGEYVLLMRTVSEDFEELLTIEINEEQLSGECLITEARLIGNTLALTFNDAVEQWQGKDALTLSFEDTDENLSSIEAGAFRVLGDVLQGGRA